MTGEGRKVVITGMGAVTPLGNDVATYWQGLIDGRSGVGPITYFDAVDLPTRIAAEVHDFDPTAWMSNQTIRWNDKSVQYGLAAAKQAVAQSGLEPAACDRERMGVLIGSSVGPTQTHYDVSIRLRDSGTRAVPTHYFATSGSESTSDEVILWLGAQGPSANITTACATGATCIGEASRMIRHGIADVMIAGGTEEPISRLNIAAAAVCRALSRRNEEPEQACRPFDADRAGFVMGAGSGVVVLEEATHAQDRGATILAELSGYGATTDSYHLTAPDPEGAGAVRAITMALTEAGLPAAEIGYVNAHGTGTKLNDEVEVKALRKVFGSQLPHIPVTSTKSMTGHLISGAGAIELIASVQVLATGIVPPTLNCDHPVADDLDFVPHTAAKREVRAALSNSFGFGGHNAVLVVESVKGRIL